MFVKALPVRGTHMRVHGTKKYYPGEIYEVDQKLGHELIRLGHCEEAKAPVPPKRGVGRPRKYEFGN